MANRDRIEQAAAFMYDTHRKRSGHQLLPLELRPHSLEEAYAAQAAFRRLKTGEAEPRLAGYKIAGTSKVIQRQFNLDEPFLGGILAGTVHDSPYEMRAADCLQFGIECEIAFRIGSDLTAAGTPYTRDSAGAVVASAHVAFELLDVRNASRNGMDAMSCIVDNALYHGVVLGPAIVNWREKDIGNRPASLTMNGEVRARGNTRDALGGPLEGLVWAANTLAARGRGLRAGDVLITGSIMATQYPVAGDRSVYEVERLGNVELRVT